MRNLLCLLVVAMATGGWSQAQKLAIDSTPSKDHFDGQWWSATGAEERSGFLNGTADCLTWTAHKKGFGATPEQLVDKITNFYKAHPESASLTIVDVWQKLQKKVAEQSLPSNATNGQGETWDNPHWYLNGDWWTQESQDKQMGFVEGYLWCMRTQVSAPAERYSGTASLYRQKIDAFVSANPKHGLEAVATTLRRYRDKASSAPPAK